MFCLPFIGYLFLSIFRKFLSYESCCLMKKWLLIIYFIPAVADTYGQRVEGGIFTYKKTVLRYKTIYPENFNPGQRYPVFLFLHGAGERGYDNEAQMTHVRQWFIKDAKNIFPGFVVVPQCPEKGFWSHRNSEHSYPPGPWIFDYTARKSPELNAALALLDKVIKKNGDTKSIYVGGLSMGGMGTFEAVYREPGRFAAAIAICGGGDGVHYDKRVTKTAFWVFHGATDPVVDVKYSQDMVAKLKELGADIKYTEYPGVNHSSWDKAFEEPDLLNWMLSKHR